MKIVPPVGQLEAPLPLPLGAGERAPLVAEELALDDVLGQLGAVELHEPLVLSRRELVDRFRDQLLPRAGLPLNQHRGPGRRDARDPRVEILHRARVAGQAGHADALVETLRQIGDAAHELLVGDGALDHRAHLVQVQGARLEVVRALAHRLGGQLDRPRVGDQDGADLGVPPLGHLEEPHPVHAMGAQLGDHDLRPGRSGGTRLIRARSVEHVERLLPVLDPAHVEAVRLERGDQRPRLGGVLVGDQRAGTVERHGSALRNQRK